jgi:NTE family protein
MPHRKAHAPALPARTERDHPRIAVALGGGGARGLAHIPVLEAFDELGIRPVAIAGTSMGAIVGAAYAAGLPARDLHRYTLDRLRDRAQVMARLLQARCGKITDLFARGFGNPVMLDGEKFLDLFWPESVPDRFEELNTAFIAVATDYHSRCEAVFESGPLVTAVAGSMAIPGLIRPVVSGQQVLIDGGVVNPLPFDHLAGRADIVIAVDVTGGPVDDEARTPPDPLEAMLGAAQIMQGAITAQKLKARSPDVLIRPAVHGYRAMDFFKHKAILAAAESIKEDIKRDVEAAIVRADAVSAARRRTS